MNGDDCAQAASNELTSRTCFRLIEKETIMAA